MPPVASAWALAAVRAVVPETATASTIVLDVPRWPGHRAGQHVEVRLTAEDGYTAQRSYSIASAPEAETLAITVERLDDGEVSPYLTTEVRAGDPLEVRGPIGGPFTWSVQDGGPLLLVAGGSGLVPLMAMLRHRAAHDAAIPASVLISVRRREDALYHDELATLRPRAGLAVRWTATREPGAPWADFSGRVDAAMLAALGPGPDAAPRVYVCGPTGFVEHVAGLLVDAGHDPLAIHTERFGPS